VGFALAIPQLFAFVLASTLGGGLVGRFGGKAGPRESAVAGLLAASTAWALTAAAGGLAGTWMLWPPVALVGTGAAWLGGRLGKRLRR
jgi:tRNA-(ms[2]io[6]A)-hydroxylase